MENNSNQTPKDKKDDVTREKMEKRVKDLFAEQEPPTYTSIRDVDAMKARISELEAQLAAQSEPGSDEFASQLEKMDTLKARIYELETQLAKQIANQPEPPTGELLATVDAQKATIPTVPELQPVDTTAEKQEDVNIFKRLLRAPVFQDQIKNRVASLQHKILVGMFASLPLAIIAIAIGWSATSIYGIFIITFEAALLTVVTIWLYRGYLDRVSWSLIGLLFAVFLGTLPIGGFNFSGALTLALLIALAGLLLRPIYVVAISIVAVLMPLVLTSVFSMTIPQGQPAWIMLFLGLEGALLTMASITIDKSFTEADQSKESLNNANRDLQALAKNLEAFAKERTHDLELATEVGYAVSQRIGNIKDVLSQAVELIRSRYGLYYTQIYLLDPSGYNLILQAATGEIGEQLLTRGHKLSLTADSLNSRAASSQRPILVADTKKSKFFLPNTLLPLTRSELAVPIIAGNEVVGVLDMQSDRPETFSEINLPAFQVLASQIAIAIQNSNLFRQTEEARQEVEEQTRRLTSAGWQDFLNAVERSETIGYAFDHDKLVPIEETQDVTFEDALTVPINVAGAHIGTVELADETQRKWTSTETEIVQTVMSRVAQHIETLRLLARAEKYRADAEDAVRRLTREGWDTYLQTHQEKNTGFAYDLNKVYPIDTNHSVDPDTLAHDLKIQNEVIGQLFIKQEDGFVDDAEEILSAVTSQLSSHIENLRLSVNNMRLLKSTEERAQREQMLRQITNTLRGSTNPATIMRSAVKELGSALGRKTVIQLADTDEIETGNHGNGSKPSKTPKKTA